MGLNHRFLYQNGPFKIKEEWVSGLHISHTFMKNYGTNKHPAKNFSNADFIFVNCVGLTPIDSKVLKYLKEKGWTVLISPYYNDNVSSKPREIDLIAEKAFDVKDNMWGKIIGTVNVKLFVECKYILQNTVFWFHDKDKQKAEELVTQATQLRADNIYTKEHHYLGEVDSVAKLFADERKKSVENEIFYKALNQSLNAMVYYRNRE